MKKVVMILILLLALSPQAFAQDIKPSREKGISIHVAPHSVVQLANSDSVQRFTVSVYESSRPKRFYASIAASALEIITKFDKERQANGVWIVLTNPDSYDEEDQSELNDLKKQLGAQGISIFQARAMNLPNGWEKISS